jgi:hypothetical protein
MGSLDNQLGKNQLTFVVLVIVVENNVSFSFICGLLDGIKAREAYIPVIVINNLFKSLSSQV